MLLMVHCTAAFTSLLNSVSYKTFYFWNDVLQYCCNSGEACDVEIKVLTCIEFFGTELGTCL